jgi:cell division initiation protein
VKLTPLDIRHKEFRRAMRGYSDEEVDVFLDEVADEFERLFQENMELRERIERLVEQVRQHEALRETLQKTLVSAQQQSDEMRANARKEAELIIKDAELKGRDLLGESYTEKQRVQQSLTLLKQAEEDFRFKFRSLLEAHITLLAEDEASDERRRFRSLVSGVESESKERVVETSLPSLSASPSTVVAVEPQVVAPVPGTEWPESVAEHEGEPEVERVTSAGAEFEGEPEVEGVTSAEAEAEVEAEGETADSSGGHKESSVRRFLFGRKDKQSDDGDFFDGPEDRDFQW